MRRSIFLPSLVLCVVASLSARSRAAVVITVEQDGSNVDVVGSGSANLAGLSLVTNVNTTACMIPNGPGLLVGPTGNSEVDYYIISGPQNLGNSSQFTEATSGTGQLFGLDSLSPTEPLLDLPVTYVSGAPLAATSEYANTTIASLGLATGTYTYTWGSGATADSMTLFIGVPALVPEPSALAAVGIAAAAAGSRRRRSCAGLTI